MSFKWILIISCVSDVRSEVSSGTLATNTTTICVGDVRTLQDLNGLVGH